MDVFSLVLRLKEEGAQQVKTSVDKLNRSFQSSTQSANTLDRATGNLTAAMKGLVAALGARELAQMSDAFTNMSARLALVTKSTQEQLVVQSQLFTLAQQTRTPFEEIVALYTKTANAATALGLSQSEVLQITSNTAKAVALSGSSASEAAGAIQQLGQAFGNGAVQAQEWNSLAEQTPRLAKAIAESFNVSTAEFRKAVLEGRVTSQQLAQAILQNKKLAEDFGKLPLTIGGAFTKLRNQTLLFVGEINKGTGAAELVVKLITWIKDNLPLLTGVLVTVTGAWAAYRAVLIGVAAAKAAVALATTIASGSLGKAAVVVLGATAATALFAEVTSRMTKMVKEMDGQLQGTATTQSNIALAFGTSNKEVKTQVELMQELAGLVPITKSQAKILAEEETRLGEALKNPKLGLEKLVELTTKLVGVRESLAKATVILTDAELLDVQRKMAKPSGNVQASTLAPSLKAEMSPLVIANARAGYRKTVEQFQSAIQEENEQIGFALQADLQNTLYESLVAGIEKAFEKGANIGDAFKSLGTTLLSGIGSVLINFGKSLIPIGALMTKLREAFLALQGPGMIAAGLGFIAIGAAMRGAASRALSGGTGGGGGGGGYSAPSMQGGSFGLATQYYGPTAAGSANTIERINPVSVTIIGPNDPSAQRQMQELMRNAQRRGSV